MGTITKEPQIRKSFESFLSNYEESSILVNDLEENGLEVILFGGIIRSYYDNEFREKPRDVDIVIHSRKYFDFENYLYNNRYSYKVNKFGGYKLELDSLNIDIWPIERTWAFKENIINFKNIKDLNETVFLSTDAIFYNFTSNELFDNGFLDSIQRKEIDIVLENNPFPELNLVKALHLKNQLDLKFSVNLERYFSKWIKKKENEEIATIELNSIADKRYGCKVL